MSTGASNNKRTSAGDKKYVDEHDGFGTTVIHAGQDPDRSTGAVCVPINLSTTFAQASPGVKFGTDHPHSIGGTGFDYSRTTNPTRGAFETCIAACEKAQYALAFASGMAAISAVAHLVKSGDHIVCIDDAYGGTQRYFRSVCEPVMGMEFSFVDLTNLDTLREAITPKTKMIWIETPTNPTLKLVDVAATAREAAACGALLVVDNTFMSPYFQNPLVLGADVVVHSVTKYINGHSDVVMGCVATNDSELHDRLRFVQKSVGAVPSPFDCYMALRGLKTLHVRMAAAAANAAAIANHLESHPQVDQVIYPGLPSHPQHELAKKQQKGFGAMVTIFVSGGLSEARKFLENLKVFTLAESLGAVESLAESPAIMTHASVPAAQRALVGISDTLVRLSVGIEGLPDLIEDLDFALASTVGEGKSNGGSSKQPRNVA